MKLTKELKKKLSEKLPKILIGKIKTLYNAKDKDSRVFYCELLDKLIKDQQLSYAEEIEIDRLESEYPNTKCYTKKRF